MRGAIVMRRVLKMASLNSLGLPHPLRSSADSPRPTGPDPKGRRGSSGVQTETRCGLIGGRGTAHGTKVSVAWRPGSDQFVKPGPQVPGHRPPRAQSSHQQTHAHLQGQQQRQLLRTPPVQHGQERFEQAEQAHHYGIGQRGPHQSIAHRLGNERLAIRDGGAPTRSMLRMSWRRPKTLRRTTLKICATATAMKIASKRTSGVVQSEKPRSNRSRIRRRIRHPGHPFSAFPARGERRQTCHPLAVNPLRVQRQFNQGRQGESPRKSMNGSPSSRSISAEAESASM